MNHQSTIPFPPETPPFVVFWNEVLAPKFTQYRHILVGGLSRHTAAVIPGLRIAPGDHVLDVACGFGDSSVAMANRVSPHGSVLGIDCCQSFITQAWDYAEKTWASNVRFAVCDVERGTEGELYDFVFSRFGTMFFTNPVSGLRAMRAALKPGGEMAHIVWRQGFDTLWLSAAGDIVQNFLPKQADSERTCGPGPFSMTDEETIRLKMKAAGFVDIAFKRIDTKVMVGRTVEEAIAFQLALGPGGETFRQAGALAEEKRPEIEAALADIFARGERNADGLWMNSSSWLITARNPA